MNKMEAITKQLKSNITVSAILALIVFCWLIVDYYIVKTLILQYNITLGFEIILLSISLVIILIFTIVVGYTLYKIWRYISKVEKQINEVNSEEVN
jgi:hypothetical protein